ncbi:DUF3549 family protein [Nitrincola tapanii]|uniref:DUF3549 family protein n=1 Tax=Nitrincola tapanii TaxID=1708751 RepID=A0A5A9W346_9GAMM|nr:DUF3549 family protein [Nitrincola tapanii]KAA0874973.1 DUF3549 family protein [Nitrincola tapanii]
MERLLTDLLQHQDNRLRFFDMGRRVSKLSTDIFRQVEQHQCPYPLPFLHQAWVGLLLWNSKDKQQSMIWFLKLPLDEQGYLIQAARDDLVNRILQNALAAEAQDDALKDNPFAFTPDPEKMAAFHAQATRILANPASVYYERVEDYLSGQLPLDTWPDLGLQGIADYLARLDQSSHLDHLCRILPQLPAEPLQMLTRQLEHVEPDFQLLQALEQCLDQQMQAHALPEVIAALLRGLSNARELPLKQKLIEAVLHSDYALEPEVILALGTRCTQSLQEPSTLQLFLERLAAGKAGQLGFNRVLTDLMFLPKLRSLILASFRDPQRSQVLSSAIGAFLQPTSAH